MLSCSTDVIIGFEQNVTRVNESQSILELCVRVLNLKDTQEIQDGFEVSLAANSIQGTAAGELSRILSYFELKIYFHYPYMKIPLTMLHFKLSLIYSSTLLMVPFVERALKLKSLMMVYWKEWSSSA